MKIVPSILSADFGNLRGEIKEVADLSYGIHFDVMDGHFVPNITLGPPIFNRLNKDLKIPFHIHLMIENPIKFIDRFEVKSKDSITFHIETVDDPSLVIEKIRKTKSQVGITLKPETPLAAITDWLTQVDMVLVLSVPPGFGGQKFQEKSLSRIRELKKLIKNKGLSTQIEVDGGITKINVGKVVKAGADIIVAGSAVFAKKDRQKAIKELKKAARFEQGGK